MLIDNHPLTQRRLQLIGIGVNKLTFKSINIKQSSNNYNIVSSFICWNQNIVHMKILHLKILRRGDEIVEQMQITNNHLDIAY